MLNKTIYIITNEDKIILRAFTDKKSAMKVLEDKYKEIHDDCYIESCALEYNGSFIEEAIKTFVKEFPKKKAEDIKRLKDWQDKINKFFK